MKVKISIILPTYNGVKYIKKSIESVLSQSFSNWELLVINDGSTDNTENFIKEYTNKDFRIIYFKNENNLGIQKTLNKGLKEAKGDYIARIDDDDQWINKDKLKMQIEFLDNNPNYVLIGTGAIVVDENDKELYKYLLSEDDKAIKSRILSKNCFIHSSVMFRKDIALKLGGYSEDKNVKHIEDYDLWLRLGVIGKLANLPIYAVRFTIRNDGISSNNKLEQFKKSLVLIKKYKNKYPNYFKALFIGYIKIMLYSFYKRTLFFSGFQNTILKFYKEF
jgi:glycosyltransferase involved in cell wall biosynthesis